MEKDEKRQDDDLIKLFKENPEVGFEEIFRKYYKYVTNISYRVINKEAAAEDIAQELFVNLWKKRETITINSSLKAYLATAARNRTLNYIRDNKIKLSNNEEMPILKDGNASSQKEMEAADLKVRVTKLIDMLPERCRYAFVLSRFENLTYSEIADLMGIAEKTVENQISKALKFLKAGLDDILTKE